ncbi:MAG: hypothetical protein M3022_04255 [Actinomycetota bacterium]|nr:hypothetical protein [Actinomycetota bacterium]
MRREHFVRGVAINELVRRTGLARNTIRAVLRSDMPPAFRCPERPSKLDSFKDEIHRLLKDDSRLPGVRVRELLEPLGFDGKTVVDDYLHEVRPLFLKLRTHQRTVYRPGEICQWDLWETSELVPVGHGQLRRAWVVVCCLGTLAPAPAVPPHSRWFVRIQNCRRVSEHFCIGPIVSCERASTEARVWRISGRVNRCGPALHP